MSNHEILLQKFFHNTRILVFSFWQNLVSFCQVLQPSCSNTLSHLNQNSFCGIQVKNLQWPLLFIYLVVIDRPTEECLGLLFCWKTHLLPTFSFLGNPLRCGLCAYSVCHSHAVVLYIYILYRCSQLGGRSRSQQDKICDFYRFGFK